MNNVDDLSMKKSELAFQTGEKYILRIFSLISQYWIHISHKTATALSDLKRFSSMNWIGKESQLILQVVY